MAIRRNERGTLVGDEEMEILRWEHHLKAPGNEASPPTRPRNGGGETGLGLRALGLGRGVAANHRQTRAHAATKMPGRTSAAAAKKASGRW